MITITCAPAATSASGGPSEELTTLRAIRTNLEAINANTDLVESLQASGNNTLQLVQAYVDGLEGLLGGLQTSSTSIANMMSTLGLNTDGIEALLQLLVDKPSGSSGITIKEGWIKPFGSSIKQAAYIWIKPHPTDPGQDIAAIYYSAVPGWTTLGSPGPISNFGELGVDYGFGPIPVATVVNYPRSLKGLDNGVITIPVSLVRSIAVFPTSQAVDYSTDGGTTFIRIASGSRVWTAQAGNNLNVSQMQFKGNAVGASYDIIYEV